MGGAQSVEIIEALSTHLQLEKLILFDMDVGRNECTALAALLHPTARLQELDLGHNDMDDEGVDILMGAIVNCNLRSLNLSYNRSITARGWRSLASLLERPSSNLDELKLIGNHIGDEGARNFVNALASNRKLKTLNVYGNNITTEGYSSFSKILCDTSSINKTFLSNHTLTHLGRWADIPADVNFMLELNQSNDDKKQVAIEKVLSHHRHFDMRPFFEWDLKVLPIAINWFERAKSIRNYVGAYHEATIDKRKLDAIYQFIRAMPEFFE